MKVPYAKSFCNVFQGPPNSGFRSVKVQTETFLKKDSRDFKNYFYSGFLSMNELPPDILNLHNQSCFFQFYTVNKSSLGQNSICNKVSMQKLMHPPKRLREIKLGPKIQQTCPFVKVHSRTYRVLRTVAHYLKELMSQKQTNN